MKNVKTEDVYDTEKVLDGLGVLLSWTLFLPLRLLVWLAAKQTNKPKHKPAISGLAKEEK
jgi:hypothetical protein